MTSFRMQILRHCWTECIEENVITAAQVAQFERHCQKFVLKALNNKPMSLGI